MFSASLPNATRRLLDTEGKARFVPKRRIARRLVHLSLGLGLTFGADAARARGPAVPDGARGFDTIIVPGGFEALRQTLPLPGRAEDWRTIPIAIELSFSTPDGLRFVRTVNAHAALLRRLHDQSAAVSADRTLSLNLRQQRRKPVDELLGTLGFEFDDASKGIRPSADDGAAARRAAFTHVGLPIDDLASRLNAGQSVSLVTRDDEAPLPLGARFWQERFDPAPPPHDLLWAILSSAEMSSLYYGLLGFDVETLQAISADPALQSQLVRHALAVTGVVPALRIREGRVVPPGDAEIAPLWEDLVGERLDRPAQFVGKLLGTDQGRLARFYRVASVLSPESAAWWTGRGAPDGKRRESLRRTYDAFAAAFGDWQPRGIAQPPTPGPADVIFDVTVRPDGTIAGPPWQDFWRRVFESDDWPGDASRDAPRIDTAQALDPSGLLRLLCPARCDPDRIAIYALIQREFPQAGAETAGSLIAVARARARYPSLALAVERMRLGDANAYAKLGGLAHRLESVGHPAREVALVQLQASIALLERWRQVGAPAAAIREAIDGLAALDVNDDGFDGGIVRWVTRLFAPAADETVDSVTIRRLAGSGWQSPGAPFEWEGVAYRVDVATSEEQRIRAVRDKFSTNTLDTAAALVRLADGVAETMAANRVDALVSALTDAADGARDVTASWSGSSDEFDGLASAAREAAEILRRARPADRSRIERAAQSLRRVADVVAADALGTLVYALAIHDPDGPFTMSREYPRRHHLYPESFAGTRVSPWLLPQERFPERGMRHVCGSLIGLDAGVPQLAQRRLTASRPDQEPNISAVVSFGMQRAAALSKPWTVDAADLVAIEQARVRGEQVVAQWSDAAALERSLAPAGIVGAHAGWLRWAVRRGRPTIPAVTLEETVRLGGLMPSTRASWGVAPAPAACLCLVMPAFSWEMRGEPRQPEALAVVEPAIRTAIEVQRRTLPAAIAPGVLALLMTDLSDHAALPYHADSRAISEAVRQIASQRFDDYIAAVAARGPLVRVSGSSGSQR